jgi:hypothetical protein
MSAQGRAGSAMGAAGRAGDSTVLENLARVGLFAYGIVHLLVAWLALQLAWGAGAQSADQSGAMATLAQQPLGKPLLWMVALGLLALAGWQAAEVLRRRSGWSASGEARTKALKKSGKSVVKAVVYLGLGIMALRFATGGGASSAQSQQHTTAGVFAWPGGRWLVALAGLVLISVGAFHVYKGVTKRFLKEIDLGEAPPAATRLVTRLGQAGFPGKGVALAVVGGLLGTAAVRFDPARAAGLDGALRTILDAPFGRLLLTLVALGIAAFGAYLLARARYPERT